MSIKKKLTGVAVDSLKDYLMEKLEKLKQLDLDQDGQKDVDQCAELLTDLTATVKDTIASTDFPKLALGIEQMTTGMQLIGASIDRQKWGNACNEIGAGLKEIGHLLQLGVKEMQKGDEAK